MDRIRIYTYKINSIEEVFEKIAKDTWFITNQDFLPSNNKEPEISEKLRNYKYVDISLLLLGDYERVDFWLAPMIIFAQKYLNFNQNNSDAPIVICDKRYATNIYLNLPYFFSGTENLESYLGINNSKIHNIVDVDEELFKSLKEEFSHRLFGNNLLKERLFEELRRFRNFNLIGERKIFSVFLCGPSGIGKTESAWILHELLASGEKFIKINLGNYSEQNALSSLIGSPRGYIGSNKGELSEKVESSRSTIILIDEFEKASKEIHNFFLELLSYGSFTDSLGREFDLDKYIVVFTSNLKRTEIGNNISPELWSRFDLKYELQLLTEEDKKEYVQFKVNYYLEKVRTAFLPEDGEAVCIDLKKINVNEYDNMRLLNREIETLVSECIEQLKDN